MMTSGKKYSCIMWRLGPPKKSICIINTFTFILGPFLPPPKKIKIKFKLKKNSFSKTQNNKPPNATKASS
jgi:hypothetical protein